MACQSSMVRGTSSGWISMETCWSTASSSHGLGLIEGGRREAATPGYEAGGAAALENGQIERLSDAGEARIFPRYRLPSELLDLDIVEDGPALPLGFKAR